MNRKSYGSFQGEEENGRLADGLVDFMHKSVDFSSIEAEKPLNKYKSDTLLNYYNIDNSLSLRRDSNRTPDRLKSLPEHEVSIRDDYSQTTGDIALSTCCKCSYIIEPMAFIQNLAMSIMNISLGQFIYNRILTRLINQASSGTPPSNRTNQTLTLMLNLPLLLMNGSQSSCPDDSPNSNGSNVTNGFGALMNYLSSHGMNHKTGNDFTVATQPLWGLTPDDMSRIRTQAQSDTAQLYFVSALFSGIPVIVMTNLLGVNCSTLGRKTLMIIYLSAMSVKFTLIMFQCLYPEWPDWLFYVGALIEGISGSSGVFYLSLYCYIADFTAPSSRSYRITLLNNLNSLASLCVTFACGYVIKYYGYLYLFMASLMLMVVSLVYTMFFIPEPLVELRDKSILQRLKLCSLRKTVNCFSVYFSKEREKCQRERIDDESERLLAQQEVQNGQRNLRKQTFVLLLIVFANFLYNFGTNGIGSIFTLFIMNAPYCFDSVQISNYSVFATVISLVMSLLVSKFVKINDLLICILSIASYFASVICYIYGNSVFDIYLGAVIASIAGLEYGYVRSIVSKSVEKDEVADALSLILIVDTFIGVVSMVLFPILYSHIVSKGISILFSFSNGFVLMALICHIVNYFLYIPVDENGPQTVSKSESSNSIEQPYKRVRKSPRYVSLSETNLTNINYDDDKQCDNDALIRTVEHLNTNPTGESILNPHHQSLLLSSVELI